MALMSMQSYQPLQTGQTTTQTQSGAGTWLPQLLGAGMGIASAAMGMPGLGGGGGGGFSASSPQYMNTFGSRPQTTPNMFAPVAQPPSGNPWGEY